MSLFRASVVSAGRDVRCTPGPGDRLVIREFVSPASGIPRPVLTTARRLSLGYSLSHFFFSFSYIISSFGILDPSLGNLTRLSGICFLPSDNVSLAWEV